MSTAISGERAAHRADYHGTGGVLFAIVFKNLLLTILTLGIYLPWARTERRKYVFQNLSFDGHRFRWHGTGREMFVGYAKVLGAYALLFGIPALVAIGFPSAGWILQIAAVLIAVPLIPLAIYGSRRYLLGRTSLRGVRFGLEPGAAGYLRLAALVYWISAMTFGLYLPVATNRLHKYIIERSRFGTAEFRYDGSNRDAWKISVRGVVLSILTGGIYYPWYAAKVARFRAEHTHVQGASGRLELSGGDMFRILIVSVFGTVFSLGLAFPWITTYVLRTMASKVAFVGALDYSAVAQRAASGDAAAEGFADALDVDLAV
jgi:uncharacterized membrane protein YjgN (DUF898 family)